MLRPWPSEAVRLKRIPNAADVEASRVQTLRGLGLLWGIAVGMARRSRSSSGSSSSSSRSSSSSGSSRSSSIVVVVVLLLHYDDYYY